MRKDHRQSGENGRAAKNREASKSRLSEVDTGRQDYSDYHLSWQEWLRTIGLYVFLDVCISYLFFYSWSAFLILLPGLVLFVRSQKKALLNKRRDELRNQFLDGIQMMAAALQAGYSAENAVREALKEMRKIYPPDAFIVREFWLIDVQLDMSRNLEELFLDFGRRSGVDDIQSFAEVFMTARRSGGDLLGIIRNTVSCIRQKQETLQEIETCLAGKVMEQKIMSVIPIFILAYIKLSSPEFLEAMYGNITGTAVMTVCFVIYAAAYFWGRRIVQIEV